MDPTFFRPAATDFDALTALWEASVRATHHFLDEAYIRYLKPLIRNEYLKSVELYGLRGNDGAIVAFMGVSERKIEMLYVDPAFREMGLGRHLVEYAIDTLPVWTSTSKTNRRRVFTPAWDSDTFPVAKPTVPADPIRSCIWNCRIPECSCAA